MARRFDFSMEGDGAKQVQIALKATLLTVLRCVRWNNFERIDLHRVCNRSYLQHLNFSCQRENNTKRAKIFNHPSD